MLANKLMLVLVLAGATGVASAQALTVGEAVRKQSEIARAELEVRLEETRKKLVGAIPVAPITTDAKDADELLSLVSVYGVGKTLKADFLFRGAIVTMTPGGPVGAVGWRLESLSATQAVLVKKEQNAVVRRSTLYLEGVRSERAYVAQGARDERGPANAVVPPASQAPIAPPVAASGVVSAPVAVSAPSAGR